MTTITIVDATDMSLRDSVKTAKQPGELRELCFSQPSHNKLRKYDGDVLWKRQQLSHSNSKPVFAGWCRIFEALALSNLSISHAGCLQGCILHIES